MLRTAAVFALVSGAALSQTAPPKPEFEVATVRVNKSGALESAARVLPAGEFMARNLTMSDILQFAYDVPENYIMGAPGWFKSDHFDIVGKSAPNTPEATFRVMLQIFLSQEFKLAVHQEQKPMDVFALVVGKGGHKLRLAAESGTPKCDRVGGPVVDGQQHVVCKNMGMPDLARTLPNLAPRYVDRVVVDLTGLTGTYDFKLDWVGANFIDQGGLTMPDAVDKLLGLRLEGRKLTMPIVIIDHVEKLAEQ